MQILTGNDTLLRCTLIHESTLDACVGILSALQTSIAGLRETTLYKTLCRDGFRGYPVVCILATSGDQPTGIVLAVINYAAYWRRFPIRHPLLALRILATRVGGLLAARPRPVSAHTFNPPPGECEQCSASWAESNRHIAKILYIGVLPAFQRQGIGRALYSSLFSFLKQNGVQRVDARIAPENLPSIRLHRESGWKVFRDTQGVLATISLQSPSLSC